MTNEEAIAHLKERNKNLVKDAKDENVYDYEKQVIEADCMRSYFEVNEKAIQAIEQISHLKRRPCEACEFYTGESLGCSEWECVFEGSESE